MRKLRTQRDNQQWMLDLALNMRGRVQNFERDDAEVPQGKRARNYRMLPKVWREAAARHEALARRAQAQGFNEVATYLRQAPGHQARAHRPHPRAGRRPLGQVRLDPADQA